MKTAVGPATPAAAVSAESLKRMSRSELDEIFRRSPAGPVPNGQARGTAILIAGSFVDRLLQGFVRALCWRGKAFVTPGGSGTLKNLIGPFSTKLFEARVYIDKSWFAPDGEAVILDYTKSSILVRAIRDEIRLVGDRLYLGQVFWGRTRIAHFMLEFPPR